MIRRPPRSTLFPTRRSSDLTASGQGSGQGRGRFRLGAPNSDARFQRSEEHTSELQSQSNLVCRLLLEKKKQHDRIITLLYIYDSLYTVADIKMRGFVQDAHT